MKKFFCVFLIMTSTLSFIGCGEKKENVNVEDNNTSIAEESNGSNTVDLDSENLNTDIHTDVETSISSNEINTTADDTNITADNTNTSEDTSISNVTTTNNDKNTLPSSSSSNENSTISNSSTDSKGSSEEKTTPEVDTTERTFKISTIDPTGESEEVIYSDSITTVGVGVADNLRFILGTISANYFDQNGVELKTIQTIGETKIAVVNLTGDDTYWNEKFADSTQALTTEHTLIENILQKDYSGYWINGVKFLLNGSAIVDNGHIPNITTTSYRES